MLQRIPIFCLLGPALCYIIVLALEPKSIANALSSMRDTVPGVYLVLGPPFFLGALADLVMKSRWQMLFVVAVVLVATPIAILTIAKTSDTIKSASFFLRYDSPGNGMLVAIPCGKAGNGCGIGQSVG